MSNNTITLNDSQIEIINSYFKERIIDPKIATDKSRPVRINLGHVGDEEIEIRYPGDGGYTAQTLTPGSISNAYDVCDADDRGLLANKDCDTTSMPGENPLQITPHEVRVLMAAIAPTEFMPMNPIFQDSGVETLRKKLGL